MPAKKIQAQCTEADFGRNLDGWQNMVLKIRQSWHAEENEWPARPGRDHFAFLGLEYFALNYR